MGKSTISSASLDARMRSLAHFRPLGRVVFVALLIGCGGPGGDGLGDPFSENNIEHLKAALRRSTCVFSGVVVEVGPRPPTAGSGQFPSYQKVKYRLSEVLHGKMSSEGDTLVISHLVMPQSATAEAGPDSTELSKELFAPQSSLLIFAREESGRHYGASENCGVIPATKRNTAALKRMIEDLSTPSEKAPKDRGATVETESETSP